MERRIIVKLKFVRSWRSYRLGQMVDIPGGLAAELIARKVAVEDKQQPLIETAAVEMPARTADATPRRKRTR
jgi:hypothetical protein